MKMTGQLGRITEHCFCDLAKATVKGPMGDMATGAVTWPLGWGHCIWDDDKATWEVTGPLGWEQGHWHDNRASGTTIGPRLL